MTIVERFEKRYPNAKVYWNGSENQLSLHFVNEKVDTEKIKLEVHKVLNFCGLLRAVESVKVLSY